MSIENSWRKICEWYRFNTPPGTFEPSTGASKDELAQLQSLVGVDLPRDFHDAYRIHNGTNDGWLANHGMLLSLDKIARQWTRFLQMQNEDGYGLDWPLRDLEEPSKIKSVWWNPLRIPITDNGGCDPVTLDLDPAANVGH